MVILHWIVMSSTESKTMHSWPSAKGFTLLEIMVAVAVIGIAMVTLIGSQSQSISIAEASRFETMAALLAQQQLAVIVAEDFDDLTTDNGDFGDDYPGFLWKTEIVELLEDDIGIEDVEGLLKAIDLTVFNSGDESMNLSIRTIVMSNSVPDGS